MGAVRRLPAAVLLIVLALLPWQAWWRVASPEIVISRTAEGISSVTWAGTVAPDGRLAVRVTYDLDDRVTHEVNVRVPDNSRFVTVNGDPVRMVTGRYGTVEVTGDVVIEYERHGAITRFEDGALLQLAGISDFNGSFEDRDGLFVCPRCYIEPTGYGDTEMRVALFLTGADDVVARVGGMTSIHDESDPGVMRLVGVSPGTGAASMVAALPATAVPDMAIEPGSVADAYEDALDTLGALVEFRGAASGAPIDEVIVAALLTLMLVALLAWIVLRVRTASHDHDTEPVAPVDDTGAAYLPPHQREPALVAAMVGDAGPGRRSATAGALLSLAHRGVIDISGVDSQRFVLTIPPGAKGSTRFEEAVLHELRPQGQLNATATLTGPPLWGPNGQKVARHLHRIVRREALREHLLRYTLSGLVLVPGSIAMGVVALIGSGGLSALGWFAALAGPVVAVAATLLTGLSLTRSARSERVRWLQYASWLRSNSNLAAVGAPGVVAWGEVLPHAAALGAAPKAAEALSPRTSAGRLR